MNIPLYLSRIQFSAPIKPDARTLKGLQRAHMQHVPFENLDIALKRPILLSETALWNKIILQRRGGFCYELNGLFAGLLKEIGFHVTYLNARVYTHEGNLGIDFDHLALLVQTPDPSGSWLADVGFGDAFNEPLSLEEQGEQVQDLRSYRLERLPDGYSVWQTNYDGSRERQYFFDLEPHSFPGEYESACLYHQTSPRSSFTRGNLISRARPNGRVTLTDHQLILTEKGRRSERAVGNNAEYQELLKEYFEIVLENR